MTTSNNDIKRQVKIEIFTHDHVLYDRLLINVATCDISSLIHVCNAVHTALQGKIPFDKWSKFDNCLHSFQHCYDDMRICILTVLEYWYINSLHDRFYPIQSIWNRHMRLLGQNDLCMLWTYYIDE